MSVAMPLYLSVGCGGLGSGDLRPPLEAARSHVELDLVSWERVAARAPPRREVIRIGEGSECQLSGCVENAMPPLRHACMFGGTPGLVVCASGRRCGSAPRSGRPHLVPVVRGGYRRQNTRCVTPLGLGTDSRWNRS